jgi:3-hydroxybutyryl-CoA dehydratase
MSLMRQRAIAGLAAGDSFSITRSFTADDSDQFAEISGDYNPVHFDDRFAEAKAFRGRICQGLLVAGMCTEIGGQIGWLASGMNFRFRRPVYFGDTVECRMTIVEIDERNRAKAEAVWTNQDGEVVIEASVTGVVPGEPERRVMEAMVDEGDPTNLRRD